MAAAVAIPTITAKTIRSPRPTTSNRITKPATKTTTKAHPRPMTITTTTTTTTTPSPKKNYSLPTYSTSPSLRPLTPYQRRIYTHLLLIPAGRVSTYASLSRALSSSPRAVGNALRTNPYAPHVPCHRVISASGFVGGFKGEWEKAASGVNQGLKLGLLGEEGVGFDDGGKVREGWRVVEVDGLVEEGEERGKMEWARKELERIEKEVKGGTLVTS